MSRRYLAVLAAAAVLVLAVGLVLRGRLLASAPAAATAAPPSEAATLRELTQAAQLDRMAAYLDARVAAVAPRVMYVAEVGAGGVRWGGDTVLTAGRTAPVVFRRVPAASGASAVPDPALAPAAAPAPPDAPGWLLVVGRAADGRVLSTSGLAGGRHRVRCGADVPVGGAAEAAPLAASGAEAYLLSAPLPEALAGAGVFDLGGRLLGVVARCPGGLAALTLRDARRLAAAAGAAPALGPYGLALAPLDGQAGAYAGTGVAGLFVAAVRRGGPADVAGLRVGDVVRAADDAAESPDRLDALLAGPPADGVVRVLRQRGRSRTAVRLALPAAAPDTAADATPDLAFAPDPGAAPAPAAGAGVPIATVRAGSAAAAAGLHPGDRLVRVDDAAVADSARAERALGAPRDRPALLVVLRDGVERAVWLPATPSTASPATPPAGARP